MTPLEFLRHLLNATFSAEAVANHFSFIDGLIRSDEGYVLFLTAMNGPGDGLAVEIGSFTGKSTCFLALGSKMANRGRIVAIDTFSGSPEHQKGGDYESGLIVETGTTFDTYKDNLIRAGLEEDVETIKGASHEVGKSWSRPIRLLFIDGEHSYNSVKTDFELFSPHVVAGGLVIFHDLGLPDVKKFFDEIDKSCWRPAFSYASIGALEKMPQSARLSSSGIC
jgi:predicted O-methyltransferase YrrM